LISEAESADVDGWGFGWLDGRATEERPPWGYARLLAERLGSVQSALDIDTGGGEVVNEAPKLPPTMYVSEGWAPNARRARELLGPRGVTVIETSGIDDFPIPDGSLDLVSSRHPIEPQWALAHRVLRKGGHYVGQHVGPESARELIEFFVGPLSDGRHGRDPQLEVADAERAGLTVTDLQTARCRMEFFDVGAVVWILRKCVWWVPDFSVNGYLDKLHELDGLIRRDGAFVAHSTRHLIEATR
jgi:SAM-dependent methyltransferase